MATEMQFNGAVSSLDQHRFRKEYELLAPHLSETVACVLDIGCGLGVMDVYLARYQGTRHIHLADGTGKGIFNLSYTVKAPEPWNDVHKAREFVSMFAPSLTRVQAHDVAYGIPEIAPAPNLIMSLLSCGFHYPIETYLGTFLRYPEARVLIDLREYGEHRPALKGEETMIDAGYQRDAIVQTFPKGKRVLFSRLP